ncbi:sensor histidine kinase [Jiangella rhizosphaerae]|uniref:histidine kinase n=1 Tax=Jiangella rhizosphaerae TaxID=2293569 RepID=A0A418KGA9_9ACTN|nr:sensor histidine kinase [Jiangella rhizosphaerae]
MLTVRRRDRLYAWVRRHPVVPDAVIALGVFVTMVVFTAAAFDPAWAHFVLGTVMCAALVFRRVRPVESFGVLVAAGLVQWATGLQLTPYDVALLLGLYAVSAYGPRWASWAGLAAGFLGVVLGTVRYVPSIEESAEAFVASAIGLSATVIGAWAMGDVRRTRQAYVAELVERAHQAERERDQRALLAAAEERSRIAREMHDVVAHNLSVIVVQADGGRYAGDHDPQAALDALKTIGDTGRGALAEMRRLLGVLRTTDDADGGSVRPQPGLGSLPELVTSVRQAGLPVELDVTGPPRPLPPGPSLAVYRVIQEALTNALKHAGPAARAKVALVFGADRLTLRVSDDGRGAAAPSDGLGQGLAGMRERMTMYGGTVTAGPAAGGGWRVDLDLPYGEGK